MRIVKLFKKISIFVILAFIFIIGLDMTINAKPYVSEEFLEDLYNRKTIYYQKDIEFNYIIERSYDEYIHLGDYLYENFDNDEVEGEYTLVTNLEITMSNNTTKKATMSAEYVIKGNHVAAINFYFNEYLYYHFKITSEGGGSYYEFEGYDISSYYGEYVKAKIKSDTYDDNLAVFDYYAYNDVYFLEGHEYDNTYFILYYLDESDNEMVIDFENPMELDDIIDTLGIKNKSNKRIGDYEIIETNYDSNNVNIGMYKAKIIGIDTDYSIYLKEIYIIAKRLTNPINTVDIRTRYNEPLGSDDIINKITINCAYDEITCTSSYFNNNNLCKDYTYTINIKTREGQYFSKTGTITVYDDIPPIIDGPDTLQTDTENRLMEDEILNKYIINDDYSNDNLRIELIEENDPDDYYINNYNLSGVYKMRIDAYDKYENYSYKNIKLYVNIAQIKEKDDNTSSNNTNPFIHSSSTTITTSNTTTIIPIKTESSITPTIISTIVPSTTETTNNIIPTTIETSNITTPSVNTTTNYIETTSIEPQITPTTSTTQTPSRTSTTTSTLNFNTPTTTAPQTTKTPQASTTSKIISPSNTTTTNNINATPSKSSTINISTSKTKKEELKLFATNKNHLSIDDIKNSLLDNNKITKEEYDKISIESDYFENYDNPGTYIINIKHEGGNITSCLIEVKNVVEEKKEENNNKEALNKKDIIFYSIIGGLVLLVLILFLIMRRKNNEKNN